MKYKELSIGQIKVRYAGWDRCFNVLPYIVIRANPLRPDWRDFSVEFGWLIWAAGFRFSIGINN